MKDIERAKRRQTLERKEEELIEQLYQRIRGEIIGDKDIGLVVHKQAGYGCSYVKLKREYTKIGRLRFEVESIHLEMESVKDRLKNGYENDYYKGRASRVNPFILHNRHNLIRFIIYHELSHTKEYLDNPDKDPWHSDEEVDEYNADTIGIKHLARRI